MICDQVHFKAILGKILKKSLLFFIYKCMYIQLWPERLTHYGFRKMITFGSKNGFKMGEQCYHIVEYVVLNI